VLLQDQQQADQQFPIPGINGPGLNPLNFMAAGKAPADNLKQLHTTHQNLMWK